MSQPVYIDVLTFLRPTSHGHGRAKVVSQQLAQFLDLQVGFRSRWECVVGIITS